ncbi:MAG: endonuclease/exonuclease/phosphatase family protein [Clostridia bacterium]|nr:endonuclease/exonuclease/phosphatase family protein [Clostridia bacterium]
MKKTRLISVLLLLALTVLPFFVGCTETTPPTETSAETTAAETEPVPTGVPMSLLSEYKLVRPEYVSEDVLNAALSIRDRIIKLVGKCEIKSDYFKEGIPALSIAEYEILIGKTDRPETREFMAGMKKKDFGYKLIGNKIVIVGGDDEGTVKAVGLFITNVIGKLESGAETFYVSENDYYFGGKYNVDELKICGIPAAEYRIVYPKASSLGESAFAAIIADAIENTCGLRPTTVNDSEPRGDVAHEILIGDTDRDRNASAAVPVGEGVVSFDGKDIKISSVDSAGIGVAAKKLAEMVEEKKGASVDVALGESVRVVYSLADMTGMSFNIKVNPYNADRAARVVKMIRNYLPDTVGCQEASPSWMQSLKSGLSDVYAYVGEGRDGGNSGEYNPIFYKKSVFNLIDSGTRWLSDTPKYPSRYPESSLNRIYTYALLERKSDGTKIMVINTHFEHTSSEARVKQAKVFAEFLKDNKQYPMIITGDFNTTANTPEYTTVIKAGVVDSSHVAPASDRVATFTNYGASNKIIDFVFFNEPMATPKSYKVLNEKIDGDWPSDHHPILVEYRVVG